MFSWHVFVKHFRGMLPILVLVVMAKFHLEVFLLLLQVFYIPLPGHPRHGKKELIFLRKFEKRKNFTKHRKIR